MRGNITRSTAIFHPQAIIRPWGWKTWVRLLVARDHTFLAFLVRIGKL